MLMTALPASIGLLPAALSHSIGSDTQRPFAIVIVGGLLPATLLTMFLLPTTYQLAERWFGTLAREAPRGAGGTMKRLAVAAVGLACAVVWPLARVAGATRARRRRRR